MPHGPMYVKFIWTTCLSFPRSCQILLQPPTWRITPFRLSATACPQPPRMSTGTCVVHRRSRPSVLLAQYVSCGTVREAVTCRRFVCARAQVPSCSHRMNDWLTQSMKWSSYWQANSFPPVKTSSHFMGPRVFVTVFTTAHHLSLFRARLIQSPAFHPVSSRSPSGLFFRFPFQNPLFISVRRTCCIPRPSDHNHFPIGVASTVPSVHTVLTTPVRRCTSLSTSSCQYKSSNTDTNCP